MILYIMILYYIILNHAGHYDITILSCIMWYDNDNMIHNMLWYCILWYYTIMYDMIYDMIHYNISNDTVLYLEMMVCHMVQYHFVSIYNAVLYCIIWMTIV